MNAQPETYPHEGLPCPLPAIKTPSVGGAGTYEGLKTKANLRLMSSYCDRGFPNCKHQARNFLATSADCHGFRRSPEWILVPQRIYCQDPRHSPWFSS
jgi:hypothetical protein